MSNSEKKKFIWDEKQTETFIIICAIEVLNGNKSRTYLNKRGWSNVQEKCNLILGVSLDMKQLKNKWDNLKNEWLLWRRLIGNETALGWSNEKRTIEASPEWWDAKLKELPAAVKFQEKSLPMPDVVELIFGDAVATNHLAWTPSLGALPVKETLEAYLEGSGDSDMSQLENIPADPRTELSDNRAKSKRKGSLQSDESNSRNRNSFGDDSEVNRCIEIIESIDADMEFLCECLYILSQEKVFREFLVSIKNPQMRLRYLKKLVAESKKT